MRTLLFHVDRSGAPTAVQFAPSDRFHALPIVIGRLEPLTPIDEREDQTWTRSFSVAVWPRGLLPRAPSPCWRERVCACGGSSARAPAP